jgi:hypothetical protein
LKQCVVGRLDVPNQSSFIAAETLLRAEFDQSQLAEREEAISLLWMDHSSLGRTRYECLGITVNKNQFSFLKKGGRADGGKGIRALDERKRLLVSQER